MNDDIHVRIDASKSDMYNALREDRTSIYYKKAQTTIFISAACVGFYYKTRSPLPSGKGTVELFNTATLGSKNSDNLWILKSIAITELGISSLNDFKETMRLCEEYANYGIDLLYNIHMDSDDEITEHTRLMVRILEEEIDSSNPL